MKLNILRVANIAMLTAWLLFMLLLAVAITSQAEAQTWAIDYAGNNSPAFPIIPDCSSTETTYFSFVIGNDLFIGNTDYTNGDGKLYRYRRSVPSWLAINPPASEKIIDCEDVGGTVICLTWDGSNTDVYEYDGTNMTERVDNITATKPGSVREFSVTCSGTTYDAVIAFDSSQLFQAYKVSNYAYTAIDIGATWGGTDPKVYHVYGGIYYAYGSTSTDRKIISDCTVDNAPARPANWTPRKPADLDLSPCLWMSNMNGAGLDEPWLMVISGAGSGTNIDLTTTECQTGGGVSLSGQYYFTRGENTSGVSIAKVRRITATDCSAYPTTEVKALDTDYSETARPVGIFAGSGGDLYVPMMAGGANSVYCYGTCTPVNPDTQQGNIDSGDFMF